MTGKTIGQRRALEKRLKWKDIIRMKGFKEHVKREENTQMFEANSERLHNAQYNREAHLLPLNGFRVLSTEEVIFLALC